MNLKSYPKYKDSGIEWLGKIPEGWEKIPIKFIVKPKKFAIKTGPFGSDLKREDFTDQGIKIFNQQNVINNDFNLGDNYINQAKYETLISFTTYPGDLLITSRGTIGKCAILPENCDRGILHPCLIRVQVDEAKCYKNFLAYVIQDSNYFYDQLLILSNATTIDVIYGDNLSNAFVLLPSINEQISITNFLDQKITRIDELIKKNEKLSELLKEKRQAVISHAVTKGLDPDARMKDSGIEWIGEVPEGWEVIPLRRIGKIVNGSTPESSNEDYWDGDIAWLTPDDLGKNQDKYITDSKRKITYKGYINCGTTIVPKDSLILSTRAPIGHLALSSLEVCFNQGCRGIIFQNNYNPSFYYYYFSTLKEVLNSYGQGTTFFELGANKLASINVVIPLLQDQTTIANCLDQKTAKIDEAVQTILSQIEKLKEYRQTLISNVVTGKVRIDEKI